ncbi:MAG: type VI secretion system contractile sheath large subunit [Planctomycetota bacterium]
MSSLGFSFGVNTGDGDPPHDGPKLAPQTPDTLPELPLRLLVVGDFRGNPASRDGRRVSASIGYNEAMQAMGVEVHLQVKDRLQRPGEPLDVCLRPTSLKELRPGAIAAQVPGLAAAAEALKQVVGADQGKGSRAAAIKGLDALEGYAGLRAALTNLRGSPKSTPAAKAKASDDAAVDRIFSLLDAPESDAPSASGGWNDGRGQLAGLVAAQLNDVLHDPGVRRMEASWLGLRTLLQSAGPLKDCSIELVDAAREDLEEVFREQVYEPELQAEGAPLSLVLLDYAFTRQNADLGTLEALALMAEELQTPLIFGTDASFVGVEAWADLEGRDSAQSLLSGAGWERWESLRKKDEARWLVAATNPVLLRLPYRDDRGLPYVEPTGVKDRLWGNPGWLLAAGALRAMAQTGWPAPFVGQDQRIDGLTLDPDAPQGGRGPLAANLSVPIARDLVAAGITPFVPVAKDRDGAYPHTAPLVRVAEQGEPRGADSLGYQLLATRLGETLMTLRNLGQDASPQARLERLQKLALAYVHDTGPGAAADGRLEDSPAGKLLCFEVCTGPGLDRFSFSLALPLGMRA